MEDEILQLLEQLGKTGRSELLDDLFQSVEGNKMYHYEYRRALETLRAIEQRVSLPPLYLCRKATLLYFLHKRAEAVSLFKQLLTEPSLPLDLRGRVAARLLRDFPYEVVHSQQASLERVIKVRIPAKSSTGSGSNRPVIPAQIDHALRFETDH